MLHLGDFFQLRPTAQLSLLGDLDAKNADGDLKYEAVAPEVQHAQEVFAKIPDVFELRGTMRFKSGDPLIDLLQCMRQGKKLPTPLWRKFQGRFAKDAEPVPDPRFSKTSFATDIARPSIGVLWHARCLIALFSMLKSYRFRWSCCKLPMNVVTSNKTQLFAF